MLDLFTAFRFLNDLLLFFLKESSRMKNILSNILANLDTLPRSETASYTSVNSPNLSSVATNGGGGNGSTHFDIDFNEAILQVHKRSPLYIIGDRAQHRVRTIFSRN